MNSFIKRIITGSIFLLIFWFAFFHSHFAFSILIIAILLEIIIFEWKNLFKINDPKFWLLMPIYPILPFILIILLKNNEYNKLLLILFILVFSFDSGAYLIGKYFGKNKLCPKISPGKTIEGFIGGIFFTLFALIKILIFLKLPFNLLFIVWFTIVISMLALLGDLFESWLKRKAGIKDSGYLLPGHGGFLDRFDGILFVIIFAYIFKEYLITFF